MSAEKSPIPVTESSADGAVGGSRTVHIALCGNPNVGKSTIFNQLTGLRQRVANYPGVTVETRVGEFTLADCPGGVFSLADIPGSYSLSALSPDEYIAVETLIGCGSAPGDQQLDLVLVTLDASSLDRGLYLLAQVAEARLPTIVIVNQADIAATNGIRINTFRLSKLLGVPVISAVANRGHGMRKLRELIANFEKIAPIKPLFRFDSDVEEFLDEFSKKESTNNCQRLSRPEMIRALFDRGGPAERRFLRHCEKNNKPAIARLESLRQRLAKDYNGLPFAEAYPLARRMAEIAKIATVRSSHSNGSNLVRPPENYSERIDRVVLHRFGGPLILLAVMLTMFQSIFTWAEPLMNLIDRAVGSIGASVGALLPEGALQSLLVDGVIGGVGSVLIFLPQIVILFVFLALLEDSGYLPRAAFIVDRLFGWCGLSGKSFVPLLSSFACAVPGIMATRVIESRSQRFLTILIAPLMSCSARLPIYTVMISAFIPYQTYFGIANSQGLTLVALYALGMLVAIVIAVALKTTVLKDNTQSFIMELPPFRIPTVRGVWLRVSLSAGSFLRRAGTVIFAIAIVVWALSYYPRSAEVTDQFAQRASQIEVEYQSELLDNQNTLAQQDFSTENQELTRLRDGRLNELERQLRGAYLRDSYFGRMGLALEPFFAPLGWDWRITMAALASFPAREVVIATLGTIYNLGAESDSDESLVEKLREAKWDHGPRRNQPVYSVPVAVSIMVFFALCCQCGATLVSIRRETNSWLWPGFTFVYMTTLAYLGSWGAYSLLRSLGL